MNTMKSEQIESLRNMRIGISLALATFVFGFGLGGLFGAAEDTIKSSLRTSADNVMESVYKGDQAKANNTVSKSWSYYKRAHMHAGGMGAAALSLMLLLALLPVREIFKVSVSTLLGIGAVGYPVFWLLAAIRAPSLGGTHAAKESLAILAIPSAGCFILGAILTLALFLQFAFQKNIPPKN